MKSRLHSGVAASGSGAVARIPQRRCRLARQQRAGESGPRAHLDATQPQQERIRGGSYRTWWLCERLGGVVEPSAVPMLAEFCRTDPARLKGIVMINLDDIQDGIKELERDR